MFCGLGRLFLVSNLSFGLSVVGFHFLSLRLFFFFSCFPWYRCVELVSWSCGLFYSELCGSSLAWVPCIWLFCLRGASYLLTGGCALGMCFPASWWFWCSVDYSSSDLFFFSFLDWCLIAFIYVPDLYWVSVTIVFCFFFLWCGDLGLDYLSYSSFFLV